MQSVKLDALALEHCKEKKAAQATLQDQIEKSRAELQQSKQCIAKEKESYAQLHEQMAVLQQTLLAEQQKEEAAKETDRRSTSIKEQLDQLQDAEEYEESDAQLEAILQEYTKKMESSTPLQFRLFFTFYSYLLLVCCCLCSLMLLVLLTALLLLAYLFCLANRKKDRGSCQGKEHRVKARHGD